MRLIFLSIWLLISVCGSALAQASRAKDPIDEILSRFARPNMPGCAVSVVQNGSVVVSRAFGLADVENRTENTPDTRFDLASMSKQFVAFAVLKVASEGKLSLTEDVHRYVPELPSYKWKITLLDLLHHTSGLKDYEELLYLAGWRYGDFQSLHDILWAVQSQKDLAFEPGTRYSYANADYFLLGLILERVMHKPIPDVLNDLVFAPLGMKATTLRKDPWRLLDGKKAWPYLITDGRPSLFMHVEEAFGAGGVFSTVEDLARWEQNFNSPKFEPNIISEMQRVLPLRDGTANDYAAGLYIRSVQGLRLIEHPGTTAGSQADKLYFPERHLSVIALCNRRDNTYVELSNQLASHFLGSNITTEPPKTAHPSSKADLQRLAGFYFSDSAADGVLIEPRDGAIFDAGTEREFLQTGDWTFESSPARTLCRCSTTYVFEFGPDGKVRGFRAIVPTGSGTGTPPVIEYKYMPTAGSPNVEDYVGQYVNDDLAVLWCFVKKQNALLVRRRGIPGQELRFFWADAMEAPDNGILQFERNGETVSGFSIRDPRLGSVSFRRLPRGQEPVPAPSYCAFE